MSKLVASALISSILTGLSYGLFSVSFPFLLYDINAAFWQIGLAESASMGLAFLVLLRTFKMGIRILGTTGACTLIVARFLLTVSYSPIQALSAYVLAYAASTIYSVIIVSAILDSVEKYRATALGVISSTRFIVSSASPIIGASLLSAFGVRGVLLINALLGFCYLPFALIFSRTPEKETIGARQLAHRHTHAFLFVSIMSMGGLLGSMYMIYERILGVYLGGFPSWVIGAYTSLESILITMMAPFTGFITDKLKRKYVIPILSDVLNLPYAFAVIYGAANKDILLYLSAPIYDALMSATSTASSAILRDLKAPTRQLITLNDALGNLSAMVGAILAGYLLSIGGAYLTLNIIVLASSIIVIIDLIALPKLYKKINRRQ